MRRVNLDDDEPDPRAAASNRRSAWHARRTSWLPRAGRFDSRTWLGEALDGAQIALALNDRELLASCMGEAAAIAIGSALARRLEAREVLLVGVVDGDLRMPAAACLASQWQQVVAMAIAGGDEATLSDLALLAMHPVLDPADNPGERYNAALAETLLSVAYDLPGVESLLQRCAGLVATPDEQLTVAALDAIVGAADVAVDIPGDGFTAQALATLARERGRATRSAGVSVPLPPGRFPTACVSAPLRAVRTRREVHWFLQVRALPGELREIGGEPPGVTQLALGAADGRWQVRAGFVDAGGAAGEPPPALDPGELLSLADQLASRVDEQPPQASDARAEQRALLADALAIVELLGGLCDAATGAVPIDAFSTVDGRAVLEREPGRFEAERLAAVARTYREILTEFDASSTESAAPHDPTGEVAPAHARDQALRSIEVLREQLRPLLLSLAVDADGAVARSLRPREGDYAKVFPGLDAGAVAAAYADVWEPGLVPQRPRPEQRELICDVAPAGMLGADNELSERFPGGYRWIAPYLDPHRVWVRWKLVRPGEQSGMAYDGLVWVDDHWAWFPKPYRALAHLRRGLAGTEPTR